MIGLNVPRKLKNLAVQITAQRQWIDSCGGTLAGYVAHYGSVNDAEHYGNGGEAIYAADMAELNRLETTEKVYSYITF